MSDSFELQRLMQKVELLQQEVTMLSRSLPFVAEENDPFLPDTVGLYAYTGPTVDPGGGAAGEHYPYAPWCNFGFVPGVSADADGKRYISLAIHNILFGSPTYAKLVHADHPDMETYCPFAERCTIALYAPEGSEDSDDTVESYIAAEVTLIADNSGAPASYRIELKEKSAWIECFSDRNESKNGIYRTVLYRIRYSVKAGSCIIIGEYCRSRDPGWI